MLDLRRCFLTAGLSFTLASMGCGSSGGDDMPDHDGGMTGEPAPDGMVEPDMEVVTPPNIGVHCDPGQGSGEDELNPACEGPARCLDYGNSQDGMCVVFACRTDNAQTGSNEDSCRLDYGNEYVCIDEQGNDDTNLADNLCVKKCVPSDTSNPCEAEFACTPNSRRFNFKDTVCFDLACQTDVDCPVSITNDQACTGDTDCLGSTDYCVLARDNDGDGTLDTGACSEAGSCNNANGLCNLHTMGSSTARVGDPCQADIDCPNGGTCVNQGPTTDANGVISQSPRNGYCTIFGCKYADATGATCPAGSACYTIFFAGGCMDNCDPEQPLDCRDDLDSDLDPTGNGVPCDVAGGVTTNCDWYGDYDCYDWGGFTWTVDQTPVVDATDGKICDYILSSQRDCSFLGTNGCAALAPTGNPAGMDCFLPRTGLPAASGTDDAGRCLDSTTSGGICPGTFDINGNCIP